MIDPGLVRRLQKDITERVEKTNEDLAKKTVEGKAGGGAVVVTANGKREVVSIVISPEVMDPNDIEMLQDLIIAATNQALEAASKMHETAMSQITGGLHLPGLF